MTILDKAGHTSVFSVANKCEQTSSEQISNQLTKKKLTQMDLFGPCGSVAAEAVCNPVLQKKLVLK